MKTNSAVIVFFCLVIVAVTACGGNEKPIRTLEVANIGVTAGSVHKNLAIVGSIHHGVSLWNLDDNSRLYNWNHKQGERTTLIASSFSPDGKWALTADTHTMTLWDTQTGEATRFWKAPSEILSATLAPNAAFALLGLDDHTAVLFDIQKGGIKHTFTHSNRVRSVDLSHDGRIAITGSEDYSTRLFDTQTGKELKRIELGDDVQLAQLSEDGSLAFSMAKYDEGVIWDTKTGKSLGALPLRGNLIKFGIRYHCAQFSRDNAWLVVGRTDQKVELWDVATLTRKSVWEIPKRNAWKPQGAAVLDIFISENSDTIFALASNGFIHTLSNSPR